MGWMPSIDRVMAENNLFTPTRNPYTTSKEAAAALLADRNKRMSTAPFGTTGQPEWARGSASWGRYSPAVRQHSPIMQRAQEYRASQAPSRQSVAQAMAQQPKLPQQLAQMSPQELAHPMWAPARAAHSVIPNSPIPGETYAQRAVRQQGFYHPAINPAPAAPAAPFVPTLPQIPLQPVNITQARTSHEAQALMAENRRKAKENARRLGIGV